MKKIFFLILFVGLMFWFLDSEPAYTPTAIASLHSARTLPRVIAHKSLTSQNFLGNTLAAIQQAANSPVQAIEVDVRLSLDRVPFLFHADRLEELTNGVGAPEEQTWGQLQKVRYQKDGSALVRLQDVFEIIGTKKILFLDVKESGLLNRGFDNAIASLIEQFHAQDTVVVESFNPFFLASMRLRSRDVMVMFNFVDDATATGEESQEQLDRIPWLLKKEFVRKQIRRVIRPDILGPKWNVAPAKLTELIQHGYPLVAWTVDNAQTAELLFRSGITAIESNRPLEIQNELSSSETRVSDAGGSTTKVSNRIFVTHENQVLAAVRTAQTQGLKISIAGRRHSMGAQSAAENSINLDMLGYNEVRYDPQNRSVTAQSGATWKKIQSVLDHHGRSVSIMQSDNIFTVGGSLSVNAHGWQVRRPPVGSSVRALRVAMANGSVRDLYPDRDPELFGAFIGGYGQFGVILEATLATVQNTAVRLKSSIVPIERFEAEFQKQVTLNPNVDLAYARIGMSRSNALDEVGIFRYENIPGEKPLPMNREGLVAIKRAIFRSSDTTGLGKNIRWWIEKNFKKYFDSGTTSRNTVMNPDVHVLWPTRAGYRDILHEYFIPKGQTVAFVTVLRNLVREHQMDLLNVTIRDLQADRQSLLPYVRQDSFSFVLFFSQQESAPGEAEMKAFTQKLIAQALQLGGTFYLPYRPHFDRAMLFAAYPSLPLWFETKMKFDPASIFESDFINGIRKLEPRNAN